MKKEYTNNEKNKGLKTIEIKDMSIVIKETNEKIAQINDDNSISITTEKINNYLVLSELGLVLYRMNNL